MKILLIGGTGTISSAITRQLAASGHDLWLLNRGNRKSEVPTSVKQVIVDINDEQEVLRQVGGEMFDAVCEFIGFVPAENPVFAMIVILDRPRGELMSDGEHHKAHDGGGTAAPLFSKIASFVAQYLEIPIEVDGE